MNEYQQLYQKYLEPSNELINDIKNLKGDIIILGAGGKMGPDLAKLAKQAINKANLNKKVIAISRFSETGLQDELNAQGIETVSADLLDDSQLKKLPDAENILYLAGMKFGTTGNESFTWAMNAYLPGRVAERYKNSRIVAFSTGNVYPLIPVVRGGASEDLQPGPVGEYAQSCLGRERLFQYSSLKYKTPVLLYRLNYANDTSYGVLLEIGKMVMANKTIDLRMGNVNVIWQGDANEIALRCLHHCETPPKILNVTGPESLSVRWVAEQFGKLFGQTPNFTNEEAPTAYLSNASECFRLFGYPRVSVLQMIHLLAGWLQHGGKMINKETHFQEREGNY